MMTISLPATLTAIVMDRRLSSNVKAYATLLHTKPLVSYEDAAEELGMLKKSVYRLENALIKAGYLRVLKDKTFVDGRVVEKIDRSFLDRALGMAS